MFPSIYYLHCYWLPLPLRIGLLCIRLCIGLLRIELLCSVGVLWIIIDIFSTYNV
ncbi:hypothetical protein DEU56DRAFT_830337 [Suillus clintonianus]|uniref:uncharacterized protein n=1 Tax=Suillus clintonianus TaxID=1904413 RepID=UPI001B87D798|nr:uncharacterized protein DEU56DRAFT_830337 [Suillus clintonianus]KAG2123220.1 hypothetical protein DEU56DRAFT_830337 [Suillus clintonianus]